MTELDSLVTVIALTLGVGWASGINLYAAVLTLGLLHNTGHATLPPGLEVAGDPLVIAAAGFMYAVEFVADKTPGVDTGWDVLHSFIRLPAGAALAVAAVGDVSPAVQIAAGLVGGTLAAGSHGLKSGGRALVNTSPEPFSNWTLSIAEDIAVIGGVWLALNNPYLFLAALVAFIALAIWLLPRIIRGLQAVYRRLKRLFGAGAAADAGDPSTAAPSPPHRLEPPR